MGVKLISLGVHFKSYQTLRRGVTGRNRAMYVILDCEG